MSKKYYNDSSGIGQDPGRVAELENNILVFTRYVTAVQFSVNKDQALPWMKNWESELLIGKLVDPETPESELPIAPGD